VRLLLLAAFLLSLTACPGPQPIPPPPGPGPALDAGPPDAPLPPPLSLFDHQVFDCHQAAVLGAYPATSPEVARCLSLPASSEQQAGDCLLAAAGTLGAAPVACLVRDLGADASAALLAGSTLASDSLAADAARSFILSNQLGYR